MRRAFRAGDIVRLNGETFTVSRHEWDGVTHLQGMPNTFVNAEACILVEPSTQTTDCKGWPGEDGRIGYCRREVFRGGRCRLCGTLERGLLVKELHEAERGLEPLRRRLREL